MRWFLDHLSTAGAAAVQSLAACRGGGSRPYMGPDSRSPLSCADLLHRLPCPDWPSGRGSDCYSEYDPCRYSVHTLATWYSCALRETSRDDPRRCGAHVHHVVPDRCSTYGRVWPPL